ncbi:MAG TPA: leucyl/phenylalanyl-tRNA--protein transferase [Vicinamibacterales bacterium]|nr:leucyl/phenylalanyl-tRNA--protein transferase [Vicinamibacterales bacterium]
MRSESRVTWDAPPQPVDASRWRFPPSTEWPDQDLVAGGADLEPGTLIDAYRRGLFPMLVSELPGVLGWWSPEWRGILPLDQLRVTRSLTQSAKRFEVRIDTCFEQVMRGCADPSRPDGWITEDFVRAYVRLHELGWAHSIEVFDRSGALAGGLYGVRIGRFFAGESMFHRQRDASKVALMALVHRMQASAMTLLDTQWCTDHLASLGAVEIARTDYLERLSVAVASSGQ